ncbi:myosin-viia [Plakobranchus ocellatus]|uniref:Myosin-viia n=1 Tax=Plakobranchus ocellatus TaxID=259542 RepID=A0AAV3ZIN2_9GAST|nr:myosin-viia [Plakobranchus ocellatus]
MTNLVINDEVTNYNLCSDWILNPARRNKYLRDEIYCQIIKQLTNNPEQSSATRGWVLLALLTALTTPTKELMDECLLFCQGSPHPLARDCEKNLNRKRLRGGCRLYSCHYLEHEMVSRQQPNIRVQIYLPNQSVQTLEVTSHTQISQMKREVAVRLHLKSINEYSIFLSSNDRVYCLSDKSFYFDCLSHAEVYWFKTGRRSGPSKQGSGPMVVMLKKIWVNGQPDLDPIADEVFHYCQEMPNYMRGYHQTSVDRLPRLAALVYRAQYGMDDKALTRFKEVASRILPLNVLDSLKEADLQKAIQEELESIKTMTSAQAKAAFLTELSRHTTYGAVFFEVRQRYVKSLPKNCLIAINYLGVHIIDQKSKELIKTFEFYMIPNWAYDDMSFTFIISDGGTWKLLVETNVGHNIDDLMMSYVAWIMNYQMRKKHGFVGTAVGESIC